MKIILNCQLNTANGIRHFDHQLMSINFHVTIGPTSVHKHNPSVQPTVILRHHVLCYLHLTKGIQGIGNKAVCSLQWSFIRRKLVCLAYVFTWLGV